MFVWGQTEDQINLKIFEIGVRTIWENFKVCLQFFQEQLFFLKKENEDRDTTHATQISCKTACVFWTYIKGRNRCVQSSFLESILVKETIKLIFSF